MNLPHVLFNGFPALKRFGFRLGLITAACAVAGVSGAMTFTDSDTNPATQAPVFIHNGTSLRDASDMNTRRCDDCHSFNELFSHPVGVIPPASMSVPANLPLVNGRVTCITCHAGSGSDHNSNRMTEMDRLSLADVGFGLCFQCHDSAGDSVKDMHARSTQRAHLPGADLSNSARLPSSGQLPDWLDSESDSCLTCHDGAMAGSSGVMSGMIRGGTMFDFMSSEHPLGVYELSDPSDSDGPLKSAAMLDNRIRLFNNHVGCGSCHSVYSPIQDLLVMSNADSQLCLGCHEY